MVSANSAESHAGIFIKLKYLAWFPLSQLEHNNDQIRVKTKQLAWRMTAQPSIIALLLCCGCGICHVMETRLQIITIITIICLTIVVLFYALY